MIYLKNFEYLKYTYLHRRAFVYTINKLITDSELKTELLKRSETHDMDKMISYLFCEKKYSSELHKNTAQHHMENNLPKSYYDFVEAVIDYECAGYTKIDKPLNAYDTILKYSPSHSDELLNICEKLGINKSYLNSSELDSEAKKYIYADTEVSEEDILKEINNYAAKHPEKCSKQLEILRN